MKLLAIILGEVWGLFVKVMPSLSAVNSFDRPPQLGAVGPVVDALTNSLHCLLL